jgi:hypothetical protein
MKKLLVFLFCISLLSCDDGDFDVPAFDFEETVYDCDVNNNSYTLYRLSDTEALIVTLTTSQIQNQVSASTISTGISATNVIYRTFNDAISQSYFCTNVPPVSPTVLTNWTGVAGSNNNILIDTVEEFDTTNTNVIGYRHTITFQNLTLENGGESLTYSETDFGSFVTDL